MPAEKMNHDQPYIHALNRSAMVANNKSGAYCRWLAFQSTRAGSIYTGQIMYRGLCLLKKSFDYSTFLLAPPIPLGACSMALVLWRPLEY